MERFVFRFLFTVLLFSTTDHSEAADIYFVGDGPVTVGSSQSVKVLFNTQPQNFTFMNGGVEIAINSSSPGVIEFTGGTVFNDDDRWAVAVVQQVTDDRIGRIFGASVLTPGMPSGLDVLFGEFNYNVIGPVGSSTTLSIEVLPDGLYQGTPPDGDVTQSFNIYSATITVIPEPTCLVLSIVSAVALLGRRSFGRHR